MIKIGGLVRSSSETKSKIKSDMATAGHIKNVIKIQMLSRVRQYHKQHATNTQIRLEASMEASLHRCYIRNINYLQML